MGCNPVVLNAEKGAFCFKGEIDGFAIADDALTVSIASLQTNAWWDAQIYAATDRVTALIGSDDSEKTPGEIIEYKPKRGFGTQTNKGSNEYILKYKSTECLRKSMDELNGQEVYAVFFTVGNNIQGIRNGQSNLDFVKSNISVSYEMVDGVDLIIIKFTFALDFETLYVEIPMEAGFTINEIGGLTGLNIYAVSCDATDLIIDIRDCANNAVDGLTTTNITAYDYTVGAAVITSGIVDNADGTYTLSAVAYVTGNSIGGKYTGPALGNLYIERTADYVAATA